MTALSVSSAKCIGVGTYPPGATYGPRQFTDWAFIWIIAGDCEYYWGDCRHAALPGDFVLERPGATDGWHWDTQKATRHAFVHFDVNTAPDEWGQPQQWLFRRESALGDLLQTQFRHLLRWRGQLQPFQESLSIATMLAAFITGTYGAGGPSDTDPPLPPPVHLALKFIYQELEEEEIRTMTLPEIAAAACVTPEHLCRIFRSTLGYGPVETVRLARLDRALSLLLHTNYAVGEIADRCGFGSSIGFTQAFRLVFQMAPSTLRRRVAMGETPPSPRLYRINFL